MMLAIQCVIVKEIVIGKNFAKLQQLHLTRIRSCCGMESSDDTLKSCGGIESNGSGNETSNMAWPPTQHCT